MKKRTLMGAMAIIALVASSASAALLADFEMNDAAGTRLAKLQNDATGGGKFNYGANNMLADGNGLMVYTLGGTNANYASAALATQTSTGIQKMSLSFDGVTLAGGGSLTYAIRDNTEGKDILKIQLMKNNDQLRLVMQNWDAGHVANLTPTGTYTLPDILNVEVSYNLNTDLANFSWTMGSDSGGASDVAIGNYTAEALRNVYQPSGMTDTDFIKTDFVKVETIPEPATLSMIVLLGGALIVIRRCFKG